MRHSRIPIKGKTMEDICELTILMPCLNDSETLATCIMKAKAYLERSGVDGEVLVADNGSTDGSQEIARSLGARVVDVAQKGYGAALLGGLAAYPIAVYVMGQSAAVYAFIFPFFVSTAVGSLIAWAALSAMKQAGVLRRLQTHV